MGSFLQPEEIIFRSKLLDIKIRNDQPLHTYYFEHLADFADWPCIIDDATGKVHTYAGVHLAACPVSVGLDRLDVSHGHVIMILLRSSSEFVLAFLGTSFCGA